MLDRTSFATNSPVQPIDPQKIRPEIQALQPQLVALRRQLHQQPELGFQEQLTAEVIQKKLQEWEIQYQSGIAQTGVVAIIQGKRTSFDLKGLALRADMDALPIQEENEVSYRSQRDGVMHACGHDGHTAIALMTAYYLSENRSLFAGTVKIIFQPAEEGPGGALPMVQAGVLKNPDVHGIIGLHLWNNLPLGTIGVRSGPLMAAVEQFDIEIQGRGGHAPPNRGCTLGGSGSGQCLAIDRLPEYESFRIGSGEYWEVPSGSCPECDRRSGDDPRHGTLF
jgi:metal-dependent amidase/aminoacylase/carboxypeptidase family protein